MKNRGIHRKRGRPRKKPKIEIEEEEMMSYEELQAKVQMLEEHNKKLSQLLSRSPVPHKMFETQKLETKKTKTIACYPKRQILLKIAYLGWNYQSSASHSDIQKMVEDKLLQALLKVSLIDAPDSAKFHRCGKADQGFNPFNQIVSVVVRSQHNSGLGVLPPEGHAAPIKEEPNYDSLDEGNIQHEIQYTELVNEVLPAEMRVVAWCPTQLGYPQRFDSPICIYKYFFPRGNLNIQVMEEAAQHLLGRHNYTSLYKKDATKALKCLYRNVYSVAISPSCCDLRAKDNSRPLCDSVEYIRIHTQTGSENDIDNESEFETKESCRQKCGKLVERRKRATGDIRSCAVAAATKRHNCKKAVSSDGYDMCLINIKGQDFLMEELRKIIAMLFHVGEGKASADSMLHLLDVKNNRISQHSMASEVPLNLYQTIFEDQKWHWDTKALRLVISQLQAFWCQQSVRATAMRHILWDFENCYLESTLDMMQEDTTFNDLPQDQCENLLGQKKVHIFLSRSHVANNDHVYSTKIPVVTAVDNKNEDFNHTATLLLIELIRERFQKFLIIHTRPAVYKEVQEEMCFRGFSFSLEKIRKKWNDLITSYQKIKERKHKNDDLCEQVSWDYYQVLDDLLGTNVLAVPLSESSEPLAPKPNADDVSRPKMSKLVTTKKTSTLKKSADDNPPVRVVRPAPPAPLATQPEIGQQSTAPVTILHHEGDTVFATQATAPATLMDEKPFKGTSDITKVFLEYNLQMGKKRLDKMEQHILYMAERAAKKLEYKRKKAEKEELILDALRDISQSSEELKNGLLNV